MKTVDKMTEKQVMIDILLSQRFMIDVYKNCIDICVSESLRDKILELLIDNQSIEYTVLKELRKRKWILEPNASKEDIENLKNRYEHNKNDDFS